MMKIESTTKEKIAKVQYIIKDVPNYGEVVYIDYYNESGEFVDCDLFSAFGDDLLVEGENDELLEDIQDLVGASEVDLSK